MNYYTLQISHVGELTHSRQNFFVLKHNKIFYRYFLKNNISLFSCVHFPQELVEDPKGAENEMIFLKCRMIWSHFV